MMNRNADSSPLLVLSETVYRSLIAFYPADYRRDYGGHMIQLFRDVCRDSYRRGGAVGLVDWWLTTLLDLLTTLIEQHRKAGFTVSKATFIQWSGWLLIFGGVFFAVSSISQLQPGSHYTFEGVYQLSMFAFVPAMILLVPGLIGVYLRYESQMNLFGRLSLLVAILGIVIAALAAVLTALVSPSFWSWMMFGWIIHLIGTSVFGGFVMTTHLLPRWNFSLLIGSALPLTAVLLLSSNAPESGARWDAFIMLSLIAISWVLTGLALNSQRAGAVQTATA